MGRRRDEWERTSWLLSQIHNCSMGVRRAISPLECNPLATRAERKPPPDFTIADPRELAALLGKFGALGTVQ